MSQTTADGGVEEFGYEQELHRGMSTTDLVVDGLVFMVPIAPWAIAPEHAFGEMS